MIRKRDSSKTRVVPVLDRLYASDMSGRSWLPRLLRLPTGGNLLDSLTGLDFTIQEARWGDDEKKLDPPVSLLSWLIRHPRMPSDGNLSSDPAKARKRQELIEGSDVRLQEALRLLRDNSNGEDWHLFEGRTQPDVFIQTPNLIIVVEGKRTEAETTKDTKWMSGRHQMLRHIDCAWEIKGRRGVIGFFIVEGDEGALDVSAFWMNQARITVSPDVVASSLPHRGPEEQKAIASCFAGVTTWQRVCAEFGMDWRQLPDLKSE